MSSEEVNPETIIFLPWLIIEEAIDFCGLTFMPIGEKKGFDSIDEELVPTIKDIISGYSDYSGKSITDFTIVLRSEGENRHDLTDDEFELASEATSMLFLSSWSKNKYFVHVGEYVNSALFSPVIQNFSRKNPHDVAITIRRRDGQVLSGGFKHGQARFVSPLQYARNRTVTFDTEFLKALVQAKVSNSKTYSILNSVLGMVQLANSDSDLMSISSEMILMGSVLESMLDVKQSQKAKSVGKKFSELFNGYHEKTVLELQKEGREIQTGNGLAESSWSVLKAWGFEFYQRRNEHTHAGKNTERNWTWNDLEHLVFVAFSFPLLVKKKLAEDGHYHLTDNDKGKLYSLEHILLSPDWLGRVDEGYQSNWTKALHSGSWDATKDKITVECSDQEYDSSGMSMTVEFGLGRKK